MVCSDAAETVTACGLQAAAVKCVQKLISVSCTALPKAHYVQLTTPKCVFWLYLTHLWPA